MPAAFHQQNFFACCLHAAGRLLKCLVHGQRVRLGMKRQPAKIQNNQGVLVNAQIIFGFGLLSLVKFKILGVNAKGYDWQHGEHDFANAQPVLHVMNLRLQEALHVVFHCGAGAYNCIPRLNGCSDELCQCVHSACRRRSVRNAAQTPSRVRVAR